MKLLYLQPATEVAEGNVFRGICQSLCPCRGGGISDPIAFPGFGWVSLVPGPLGRGEYSGGGEYSLPQTWVLLRKVSTQGVCTHPTTTDI